MGARPPRHPNTLMGLAVAMLAVVCVSACGSSTRTLDSAKVERAIANSILDERGLYTTVACPSKVVQQAGHVFTCTARLDVGSYPVTATETGGSGQVRFQDKAPLVGLDVAKVRRAIQASVLSSRGAAASRTGFHVHGRRRRGAAPLPVHRERGRRRGPRPIPRLLTPSMPSARSRLPSCTRSRPARRSRFCPAGCFR
jgi:hypothetical protein